MEVTTSVTEKLRKVKHMHTDLLQDIQRMHTWCGRSLVVNRKIF